jgi:CTP:molybdopterin cytidylyltransferase MocA
LTPPSRELGVAAVVLAAGSGSRFRGSTHKLLAAVGGRRVVDRVLDAVLGAGLDEVYVVVGALDLDLPAGCTRVENPRWAEGLATSLRTGIDAAAAGGHGAVVVGLGDQPGVTAEAWRRVAAAGAPVAVATYGGVRGHPVRLAADVWPELPATGDAGARGLLDGDVAEVPCPGSPADVDTVEDLQQWS